MANETDTEITIQPNKNQRLLHGTAQRLILYTRRLRQLQVTAPTRLPFLQLTKRELNRPEKYGGDKKISVIYDASNN
jgi:hypothetical protein